MRILLLSMYMKAIDFYNANKNFSAKLPEPPSYIDTNYEIADWLLNKSDFAWLELDIEIPYEIWTKEAQHATYVDHRGSDHPGWNSACIHGIDIEKTGAWTNYGDWTSEEQVPYKWTSLSNNTPNIKSFWKEFPYEKYRRIRLMELKSDGVINPHSDAPGKLPGEQNIDMLEFGVPINVAITHPPGCFMTLEGHGVVPFLAGKAFIINIRNYHSVINLSSKTRTHLIAHGIPGNRKMDFIDLVANSFRKQYDKI